MKCTVISRPSTAVVQMLSRRVYDQALREQLQSSPPDAVGICQGAVLEIIWAGDIAEKTSDVTVAELSGSCPQHITCLAIFGSISAVTAAIEAIRTGLEKI